MRLRKKDIINLRKIASDPKKVFVLLILGTLIFFLNSFIASQDYLQGKVVKVIDGEASFTGPKSVMIKKSDGSSEKTSTETSLGSSLKRITVFCSPASSVTSSKSPANIQL